MEGGDLKFHIYNMGGEPGFPEERSRCEHLHGINVRTENISADFLPWSKAEPPLEKMIYSENISDSMLVKLSLAWATFIKRALYTGQKGFLRKLQFLHYLAIDHLNRSMIITNIRITRDEVVLQDMYNDKMSRDCKPENILLDSKGHVRISDLGLAIEYHLQLVKHIF